MIKEYTISNFKAFSTPATLPIKPITLIYGANSAGKSSIFQSLLMLQQSIDPVDIVESSLLLQSKADNSQEEKDFDREEDSHLKINDRLINLNSYKTIIHNGNAKLDLCFGFKFDICQFRNHHLFYKFNKNTKRMIEYIIKKFNVVGLSSNFAYSENDNKIFSKILNLHIGDDIFASYCHDNSYSVINREHPFWNDYWNEFGKSIAINDLKSIVEDISSEMINTEIEKSSQNKKYSEILELYSIIINEKSCECSEDLEHFFEEYSLNPQSVYEYLNAPFRLDHLFLEGNYGGWVDLHELFSGIRFNNQKYYFTDNITITTMIICGLISNIFEKFVYVGPHRFFSSNAEIDIRKRDYNTQFLGKDGSRICNVLHGNRFLIHSINFFLSKLGIDYHISLERDYRKGSLENDIVSYSLKIYRNNSSLPLTILDVGYGIGQILPVVVQCVISNEQPILIEQPELHLHPALQAELGDLFIDSSMKNKNTLLIETHSEHILLRIMRRIRETTNGTLPEGVTPIRAEDVSVVYVESVETDGDRHSIIREMPLNDQGELVKAWPGGFFEEGLREVF